MNGKNAQPLLDRLMSKVSPEPNTGCWIFTGAACNPFGQCRISARSRGERREVLVHRLSYELHIGPIPDCMSVCHKCDVPSCVNPNHLFLGTHYDNMHDKLRKGRANMPKGNRHYKAKLTDVDVTEIRTSTEASFVLASRFGVTTRTINHVRSGDIWKHVQDNLS